MTKKPARWQDKWLSTAAPATRDLWRGVEVQHVVATMRLVDNLQEQELLEQILDASKPPLPRDVRGLPYLVMTPFRYVSPWPSRFREPDHPGAWYGADEPQTVATELAYWRWRFFVDSDGFKDRQLVTQHTFFQARFDGVELDLTATPWRTMRTAWRDPDDYTVCHQLAARLREAEAPKIASIRYESARRLKAMCQVVFEPAALSLPAPHSQQTWICKATRDAVYFTHDAQKVEFRAPLHPSSPSPSPRT
jgi:RES domain